jgi:hypothetical protein
VIHSLTSGENARISSPEGERMEPVAPLVNYTVGRIQQDFREGNTMIGAIFTSANRFLTHPNFNGLNRAAYSGGIDLLHQWKEKEYYIDIKLAGSNIQGSPAAIGELQTASARYFQRPDATYLHFDTTRTELGGMGGRIKIGKGSKGLFRYSTEVNWRSPGLELNDIGFMQMTDLIRQENAVSFFVVKPVSIFRSYNIGLSEQNSWNFGGEYLGSAASLNFYCNFLNQWGTSVSGTYQSESLDSRLLRGGNSVLVPASWAGNLSVHSDWSKKVVIGLGSSYTAGTRDNYESITANAEFSVKPVNSLRISVTGNWSKTNDQLQYVAVRQAAGEKSYVLAAIDQRNLGLTFRIDYNITNELSIQYYGSPFAATGRYNHFKHATDTRAPVFDQRFNAFKESFFNGNTWWLDVNDDQFYDYSVENPDFSFSQFRSNLVAKWEYKPGSSVYFVWSNERTRYLQPGNADFASTLGGLKAAFPNNLFLIKVNYWLNL